MKTKINMMTYIINDDNSPTSNQFVEINSTICCHCHVSREIESPGKDRVILVRGFSQKSKRKSQLTSLLSEKSKTCNTFVWSKSKTITAN